MKTKGMAELERNTARLNKQISAAMPTALKAGGLIVRNAAVMNCKEKEVWLTGNLARSIHVKEVSPTEVRIGTKVEYAPYHEFGTSKMAARPYLRPALDENKQKILDKIKAIIGVIIKK